MRRAFLICLSAWLLLSGCATQRSWVYKANTYGSERTGQQKIVVLPFRDARQNENENLVMLYLIPIMPFGMANYEIPEGAAQHITSGLWTNYKPTEDYPKALAEELRGAGYQGAYFDFKEGDADIVVRGTILNTRYSGKIISYGLSAYGPILWFVGLPAATASNELELELVAEDRRTGQAITSKHYRAPPYSAVSWIYVMRNDFNYPEMLASIYKQFLEDLKAAP